MPVVIVSTMPRLLLLALLVSAALVAAATPDSDGGLEKKRHKKPWFCHGRDCPRFKTVHHHGPFAVREYERSTWAAVCIEEERQEEAVWRATAHLLQYIKGENKRGKSLWGGTPFARRVSLSPWHLDAWNATANNETALDFVHKRVCVAYYLPDKYQDGKRPPKPKSDDILLVRAPRWTAAVAEFGGFPTRMKFIFNYMRLVHLLKWHKVPFCWRVALAFVYDPPSATRGRHNEVLVPLGECYHRSQPGFQLFGADTEELSWEETAPHAISK